MVITEKNPFFSWHLFFKLPSFLNHLSYRSLIGLKWKIISCCYWWHVSLSVSSSTCHFVGSSDHCLSSHSMNSFGTGKTSLPQCPNKYKSPRATAPALLHSYETENESGSDVSMPCSNYLRWNNVLISWFHVMTLKSIFYTMFSKPTNFLIVCIWWLAIHISFFYLLKVDWIMFHLRPMSHL